jgi:hypothetical protein
VSTKSGQDHLQIRREEEIVRLGAGRIAHDHEQDHPRGADVVPEDGPAEQQALDGFAADIDGRGDPPADRPARQLFR